MKQLKLLMAVLLLSLAAQAQIKYTIDTPFRRQVGYLNALRNFIPPRGPAFPSIVNSLNIRPKGSMFIDTVLHRIGIWNGSSFTIIGEGGGGIGTETDPVWTSEKGSYLTSAIAAATYATAASVAAKLNASDTPAMLDPYKHWTFGYLTEAAADLRYTTQTTFNAKNIFNLPGIDTGGITPDAILLYDAAGPSFKVSAFPSRFDLSDADSGLQVYNTDAVVNHNGLLLWKGRADGLYPSLTGSYANPSWITSLAWSKISGAPSFLTSVNIANINATGTPSATTYLRGDGTWATPAGGGGSSTNVTDYVILGARELGLNILGYNLVTSPFEIRAGANINDGRVEVVAIYVPNDTVLTGVGYYQTVAGNFTGDNTNSIALYSYSAGTLTKVAETANDENIFKGTSNTWRKVNFASTYTAAKGIYYVSFLYNNSTQTTSPAVGQASFSNSGAAGAGSLFTNSARLSAVLTGQTSQPATLTMSSMANTGGIINAYLY